MFDLEKGTEEATAILTAAHAAAEAALVGPDTRVVAFEKAVDILLELRTGNTLGDKGGSSGARTNGSALVPLGAGGGSALLAKISTRIKVDREIVGEVFDEQDGKLELIAPASRLDARKSPATKEIAVLVAGARQAAELEEWTDADDIRHFAEEYKRYDSANFATTLKEMEDVFRVKQTGRKITVRLGRPGWDRLSELVTKLGGGES